MGRTIRDAKEDKRTAPRITGHDEAVIAPDEAGLV
jgi:hypothetical protein